MELHELHTSEELEQAFERSTVKPILLFKHSTKCPISARAFKQLKSFLKSADDCISCYMVKVIEDRSVSNQIEAETGVKHESPQLFIIHDKAVKWQASHSRITEDRINVALSENEE